MVRNCAYLIRRSIVVDQLDLARCRWIATGAVRDLVVYQFWARKFRGRLA